MNENIINEQMNQMNRLDMEIERLMDELLKVRHDPEAYGKVVKQLDQIEEIRRKRVESNMKQAEVEVKQQAMQHDADNNETCAKAEMIGTVGQLILGGVLGAVGFGMHQLGILPVKNMWNVIGKKFGR